MQPIEITPPTLIEFPNFREVWTRRELLVLLVIRSYKSRFQQTYIGYLWIIIQPLVQMVIFYTLFGLLIRIPVGDTPYQIFFLSGFVTWQLFAQVVNGSTYSLQENMSIIAKVYFPRLVLPLAASLVSIIDFLVNFALLLIFMMIGSVQLSWRIIFIPPLVCFLLFFASGVGLWFGSLTVVFRDIKNVMGFILTMWMYAIPVIYPPAIVPERFQVYLRFNPMTLFVDTFRWIMIGYGELPPLSHFLISLTVALVVWISGAILFRYMENKVADIL